MKLRHLSQQRTIGVALDEEEKKVVRLKLKNKKLVADRARLIAALGKIAGGIPHMHLLHGTMVVDSEWCAVCIAVNALKGETK